MTAVPHPQRPVRLNLVVAGKLVLLAALMFGFGYAMVPLYEKICEATGLRNLLNPAEIGEMSADPGRLIRADFAPGRGAGVRITPSVESMPEVRPGETYSVVYTLANQSGKRIVGQAIPAYAPARAGKWFKKIQCFCFGQLALEPGETRRHPVVFAVDPALPDDIPSIALSYDFFEVEGAQ